MAGKLALIPVQAAITTAVRAVITAAVEAAVSRVVITGVSAMIAHIIAEKVTLGIVRNMTEDISKVLDDKIDENVKDILGESGVQMLAEAISATPSQVVTETLYESINSHLWVFHDTDFLRVERFVRFIHALERGTEPPTDEDPEPEENECRMPELNPDSVADDILGFMLFDNEECEGDVVNGFGVGWNKLLKLITDSVGGKVVKDLLNVVFDRYPLEEAPVTDATILAAIPRRPGIKVLNFGPVKMGSKRINNVHGSAIDKLVGMTWIAFWKYGYKGCSLPMCKIDSENPPLTKVHDPSKRVLGGHVWMNNSVGGKSYYILPICSSHNASVKWDFPPTFMLTTSDAKALKIDALKAVAEKTNKLKKVLKKVGPKKAGMMLYSVGGATATANQSTGSPPEGVPSLDPFQQWLKHESLELAVQYSEGPIKTVMKQITERVMSKATEIIQEAGSEALSWLESEGRDIMLKGLIPILASSNLIQ